MTDKPTRRFWQIHLSTAIVLAGAEVPGVETPGYCQPSLRD
jgi:hypothetical protein